MSYHIRDIEKAVCLRFKTTPEILRGPRRKRVIARPRQIAMYLAREMTHASLPQIGAYFGRDHTTVLHARKKIASMLAEEGGKMETYLSEVRQILATLTPHRERVARALADAAPAALPTPSIPRPAARPAGD